MKIPSVRFTNWVLGLVSDTSGCVDLLSSSVAPISDVSMFEKRSISPEFAHHPKSAGYLAEIYNVSPSCIVPTKCATMGMFTVLSSVIARGGEVLLETPNYEPLYRMLQYHSAYVRVYARDAEKGFAVDVELLRRSVSKDTKLIIFTNLHNPSGAGIDADTMKAVADVARSVGALVLVDEVYLDSATDKKLVSGCKLAENIISVASFSKSYGIPGFRFGWIVSQNEKVISVIRRLSQDMMGAYVSTHDDAFAVDILKNREKLLDRTKSIVTRNLEIVDKWVAATEGISWTKPAGGNIAYVKLPPHCKSMEFARFLIEKYKTLVAPSAMFWHTGYIRLAIGGTSENLEKGLVNISAALKEFMK